MAWGAPPWQTVGAGSLREARANFAAPPPEYAMTLWWFWNTDMPEAEIRRNLDDMRAHSVRSVLIWCYKGLSLEYLSPAWFERVRYAVDQAAARGMRVWIMDEGGYPSGFMGGRISRDFPGLRMQVLLPGDPPQPGFRTSPTRYVHTPGFAKDSTWSLFDALNPEATKVFLQGVHEKYREALGRRMGTTVLGIMGDEPSFPGVPWTPSLPEAFEKRKGYDVRPHLAALFGKEPSEEARRIRADYQDVWSGLYRDNFFKPQADWLCAPGHRLPGAPLRRGGYENAAEFERRFLQVHAVRADARRGRHLATDLARHRGRLPQAGLLGCSSPGRAALLHRSLRGLRDGGSRSSRPSGSWITTSCAASTSFKPCCISPRAKASGRTSIRRTGRAVRSGRISPCWPSIPTGRPTCFPSDGLRRRSRSTIRPRAAGWATSRRTARLSRLRRALLESQRDFDFVDEDALRSGLTLEAGALRNRSGQRYRTVIVPSVSVISQEALGKLKALASAGGRVVWMGRPPAMLENGSFRNAAVFRDSLAWTVPEPSGRMTPAVEAALPQPDVRLEPASPDVKYVHRAPGRRRNVFLLQRKRE